MVTVFGPSGSEWGVIIYCIFSVWVKCGETRTERGWVDQEKLPKGDLTEREWLINLKRGGDLIEDLW